MLFIESDRLIIRDLKPSDKNDFFVYRSDVEVAKFQGWDQFSKIEEAEEWISLYSAKKPGIKGDWNCFGIELKSEKKLIGDLGLKLNEIDDSMGEIGFTISREYWNKGYGFEATSAFVNYLFNKLKLKEIIGITKKENTASIKLMEKLGMVSEGASTKEIWFSGNWNDNYLFRIKRV